MGTMIKIAIVVCLTGLVAGDADPYGLYANYNSDLIGNAWMANNGNNPSQAFSYDDSREAQAVFSCDYGEVHAAVSGTSIQVLCEELNGSEKTFRCKNDEDLRLIFKKEGGKALVSCSK